MVEVSDTKSSQSKMAEGWSHTGMFQDTNDGRETCQPCHKNKRLHCLRDIYSGIEQYSVFNNKQCLEIESRIVQVVKKGDRGEYRKCTVDRTSLRNKYFFGEGYTYGDCSEGEKECLYPRGEVDPIPDWIQSMVIGPLERCNIIERGFTNSAVINYYWPRGCIVSHIDPPHLFDRPIVSVTFLSNSWLCFGCKFSFKPLRVTEPVIKIPLIRGWATSLSGFAADGITHCVRPQDTISTRAVIILRRVLPGAPRLNSDPMKLCKIVRNGSYFHNPPNKEMNPKKRRLMEKGLTDTSLSEDDVLALGWQRKRQRLDTDYMRFGS